MITVVNYGSGNIGAIANLMRLSNLEFTVVDDPGALKSASHIVVPGVGAFDNTIRALESLGFSSVLRERIGDGAAILGICVGMQILAESSEEGELPGLGIIPGHVKRFIPQEIRCASKIPHMGWNGITKACDHPLLAEVDCNQGFYFLHSYHYVASNWDHVLATTTHGGCFHSVVGAGRVFGIQFHPEKSHRNGVTIFRNFSEL